MFNKAKFISIFALTCLSIFSSTLISNAKVKASDESTLAKFPEDPLVCIFRSCADPVAIICLKRVNKYFCKISSNDTISLPINASFEELDTLVEKIGVPEAILRAKNTHFGLKILASLPHLFCEVFQNCTVKRLEANIDADFMNWINDNNVLSTELKQFELDGVDKIMCAESNQIKHDKWLYNAVRNVKLLSIHNARATEISICISSFNRKCNFGILHNAYLFLLEYAPEYVYGKRLLDFITRYQKEYKQEVNQKERGEKVIISCLRYKKFAFQISDVAQTAANTPETQAILLNFWSDQGKYPPEVPLVQFAESIFIDPYYESIEKINLIPCLLRLNQKELAQKKIDTFVNNPQITTSEKIALIQPLKMMGQNQKIKELRDQAFISEDCTMGQREALICQLINSDEPGKIAKIIEKIKFALEAGNMNILTHPEINKYLINHNLFDEMATFL